MLLLNMKFMSLLYEHEMMLMHTTFETNNYAKLENFSIVESYVLTNLIYLLHTYQLENINYIINEVEIRCIFIDESVYITYLYETPIYAKLDYDLVFDSAMDYNYISASEALQIDKIKV